MDGPAEARTFQEADRYIATRAGEALAAVDPTTVARILELFARAPTIFVYGAGRSGIIGRAFAMRLVQAGLSAYVIGESVTPIVRRGDLVVIFSNRGESYSSIQTANIVRREGADLVVVTSRPSSKLAHAATVLVTLPIPDDPDRARYAPLGTVFEAASLRVADALIAAWIEVRGETEESMRRRHAIMV
ncbi:MAG: SIS domain-containing protein [Thermoplasmata archaeon]